MISKWIKYSGFLSLLCVSAFVNANDEDVSVSYTGLFVDSVCTLSITTDSGASGTSGSTIAVTLADVAGSTLKNVGDTGTPTQITFSFTSCGALDHANMSFGTTSTITTTVNSGVVFPLTLASGTSVDADSIGLAFSKSIGDQDFLAQTDVEVVHFVSASAERSVYVFPVMYASAPTSGWVAESLTATVQINVAYE